MGYKILLADDSVTVQKIITLTFSDEGVDVLTVNNGDEAISRLQYLRPALVMADVSIPGKNGYEICEYVKNHPDMKDTPVVLLVPAFEPFDEERARHIGADQHLTKPFQSIRTLITTVKTLLEGRPPKFATGSLNPPSSQLQVPEAAKAHAAFAEAAPVAQPVHIRETQPFQNGAEEELPAAAEFAEAPQIWKEEPAVEAEPFWHSEVVAEPVSETPQIWKAEPVLETEQVLEIETESSEQFWEAEPVTIAEEPAPVFVEPEPEPIIEETPAVAAAPVVGVPAVEVPVLETPSVVEAQPVAQVAAQAANVGDPDHVLDLDDVLGWPSAEPLAVATPGVAVAAPEAAIPQTVIDEIVNRVVAQLSEKLTAQLAPEVAELVKRQTQHELAAVPPQTRRESGSLLDLD